MSQILLNQFTGCKLPSQFHEHVNSLRDMTPVSDKKTWAMWLKENHSKCTGYNLQQSKNLYFGHWLLNRAKIITADIKNMMNPLWEPLQIPSGHSVTDMIRAIRRHLQKVLKYTTLIAAYRRREEFKTNVWDTEEKRLEYVDAQWANMEMPFLSSTYPSGFLAFLVCSHPIDFVMQRRMSLPLLVPPMTMDEKDEFGGECVEGEGRVNKGTSAVVATKTTREDQRVQASSVQGTASSSVTHKPPSRKRSRKQVLLSDDESIPGEKTLTIQMQHTISRGSTTAVGNTVADAVKSLFDEVKTRKDLISQLEELGDPMFSDEILANKRRIIEVRPIFLKVFYYLFYKFVFPDI